MRRILTYIGILLLVICSCSRKETQKEEAPRTDTIPMLVNQIQKTSRLYTAECHLHKIITHDDVKAVDGSLFSKKYHFNVPFGSRKIAIPMDATVKAYVDMSKISEADVHRNGKKIEIVLPDPQLMLTSTKIDHKEVTKFVALLRSDYSDAEVSALEQQGRDALIADIPKLDIIEQSRESAARVIIPLIENLGYEEADITVSFRKDNYSLDEIKQMVKR